MIVNIVVPMHRRSLSPDRIAAHMNDLLDPSNDTVTSVTVSDDEGHTSVWTRSQSE